MADAAQLEQMQMDPAGLYREETFTDRQVGTIRRLIPVDGDGNPDPARRVVYQGHTQVMTPAGALPLSFELEADSLEAAAKAFAEAAGKALDETMEELRRMQREQQNSLYVPGQEPAGGLGGAAGGGPFPGGKFKL